tara:strand:+ start:336 stop:1793 length:1458 start_codon:yes stop_codon:yes gene_type:complete
MKLTLIDPLVGQSHGLKSMTAYLQSHGHEVKVITLNTSIVSLIHKYNHIIRYTDSEINEILKHCKGSDIVGITVFTNAYDMARHLTSEIRGKLDIPIIWGGIHPTLRPKECMQFADMVCIGEGELSLLELLNHMEKGTDYTSTKGIWFKKDGELIQNQNRALINDLDMLPIEELRVEKFLQLVDGKIIVPDRHMFYSKNQYSIATSRGCVYECTYCAHNHFTKLFGRKGYHRRRSVPHFMEELKIATSLYDNIERICFDDDTFLIRPVDELKTFAEEYQKEIGLPFFCLSIPKGLNKEKLEIVISAGMVEIQFGIEATSRRILKMYSRPCYKEDVLKSDLIVQEVSKKTKKDVLVRYDLILDNPWETREEKVEGLDFLKSLPRPYIISYFSLVFYPEVELSKKAIEDGYVTDELADVYRKSYQIPKANYINLLFYLLKYYGIGKVPYLLMVVLSSRLVISALDNKLTEAIGESISKLRTRMKYQK